MKLVTKHSVSYNFPDKELLTTIIGLGIIAMLIAIALVTGYLAANGMIIFALGFIAMLMGGLVVYCCLFYPISAYYLVVFIAFFSAYPGRLLNRELPITTFVELSVLFLFIGTYWNGRNDQNQKGNLLNYSVTIFLFLSVAYFILELFNPNMDTKSGWLFSSKRFTVQILFFVISYRLINTLSRLKYFFNFWILMSFITALYGCYQQWFGLFPFELNSIDPHEFGLLFQGGVIRKFSFLEGVVTFGNQCGSIAIITSIFALNEKSKKKRNKLIAATIILYLGMSYSGTRTTNIMIPAGIALYVLMSLRNRATIMTLFATFLGLIFIIYAPVNNRILNNMRSTFDVKDESLNVRNVNRKFIQPYIYANPIGGGVAASGVEGLRFNPSHPLAGFPPDSGLLKLALEMGWLGLVITMLPFLIFLYQGIYYYFRLKNAEYKKYMLAIICSVFSVIVTLYSQVSIGVMPGMFFIFGIMSILKRIMEFDQKENTT